MKTVPFSKEISLFVQNVVFPFEISALHSTKSPFREDVNQYFPQKPYNLFDRCKKIPLNPTKGEEMVNVENRCQWPLNCMNKQNEREICAIQYHKLLKQPFLFVCTKLQNHSPIFEAVLIASIDKRFMSIFRFHFVEYFCLMLIVNLSNSNLF